jgi:hypothetical protein
MTNPNPNWDRLGHLDKIEDLNERLNDLAQQLVDDVAALNTRIDNLGPGGSLPDVIIAGFDQADFASGATLLTVDLNALQPATQAGYWLGVLTVFGDPTTSAPAWVGLQVDSGFPDTAKEAVAFGAGTPSYTLACLVKASQGDTLTFTLDTNGPNMTLLGEVRLAWIRQLPPD